MKKDYSRERNATITPMQEEDDDKALNQPGLKMVLGDGGLSCGSIDCSAVLVQVLVLAQEWRTNAGTGTGMGVLCCAVLYSDLLCWCCCAVLS
jgi:hypothetical protein